MCNVLADAVRDTAGEAGRQLLNAKAAKKVARKAARRGQPGLVEGVASVEASAVPVPVPALHRESKELHDEPVR